MAFTLRTLLGDNAPVVIDECPTGKRPFTTKDDADRALRRINPTQRTHMRRYRCAYCQRYHLGHRRGAIS